MKVTVKHGPGRPPKYGRPSRAVTVTLPEDVLARLRDLDYDLGRAIVRLAERQAPLRVRRVRPAELTTYGNHAIIVVHPANALKRIAGVQLVPVGNGRALISLDAPNSVPTLELAVRDAIERGGLSAAERDTLEAIVDILRQTRGSKKMALAERTIIVLQTRGRASGRRRLAAGSR